MPTAWIIIYIYVAFWKDAFLIDMVLIAPFIAVAISAAGC